MQPPKWLRKYFPKKHEITNHRHLSWLGKTLHDPNLWHFNRKSISLGFAVGLLAAFIPLPIQMVLAVLLAILVRGNLLLAASATWITNPVTFLPLNYFIFRVGRFITQDTSEFTGVPEFNWDHENITDICAHTWEWLQTMGKPFLVGLPIVALSTALAGYILINILWSVLVYIRPKNIREKLKRKKDVIR